MKKCSCCKQMLDYSCFHRNKTRGDGLRAICKVCAQNKQRAYIQANPERNRRRSREWYHANKDKAREINQRAHAKNKAKLHRVKADYFDAHPCPCGESRHPCLDFHHPDPSVKEREVSKCRTVKTFLAEAAKCTVLCANCHRMEHAD